MASSLWGHRQTEDENRVGELAAKALTAAAAADGLDHPDISPSDEIADFDGGMEVELQEPEVKIPEVEIPDDAKDETPKMGVGEHSRMTVRQETGKRADEVLHGGDDLFTKTMELFGVSREGSASALIHTPEPCRSPLRPNSIRE